MESKIALLGAAGAIGQSLAQTLRSRNQPYRVVGRTREQLERTFGADPLAEIVTWNLDDPASVRAAVRSVTDAVYLIGVPYDHFELHPELMRKTLAGVIAEGVQRFLLIGTVYPYGRPTTSTVNEQHPRNPHTFKGRMRKEQEDLVFAAHAAGQLKGAVLRLPDFYGPGVENSFVHSVFPAAASGKTANMIGPIDTPHEFVYVPDAGPVAIALLERPEAFGHWWNFAGVEAITQRSFAEKVFAAAGSKPKLRAVGKLGLRVFGLFQPFMKELVEMHYLFETPVLMDDGALRQLLGDLQKTPYEEGIRKTLAAYKSNREGKAQ